MLQSLISSHTSAVQERSQGSTHIFPSAVFALDVGIKYAPVMSSCSFTLPCISEMTVYSAHQVS